MKTTTLKFLLVYYVLIIVSCSADQSATPCVQTLETDDINGKLVYVQDQHINVLENGVASPICAVPGPGIVRWSTDGTKICYLRTNLESNNTTSGDSIMIFDDNGKLISAPVTDCTDNACRGVVWVDNMRIAYVRIESVVDTSIFHDYDGEYHKHELYTYSLQLVDINGQNASTIWTDDQKPVALDYCMQTEQFLIVQNYKPSYPITLGNEAVVMDRQGANWSVVDLVRGFGASNYARISPEGTRVIIKPGLGSCYWKSLDNQDSSNIGGSWPTWSRDGQQIAIADWTFTTCGDQTHLSKLISTNLYGGEAKVFHYTDYTHPFYMDWY